MRCWRNSPRRRPNADVQLPAEVRDVRTARGNSRARCQHGRGRPVGRRAARPARRRRDQARVAAGRLHPRRDAGEARPRHHLYLDELQQERARARPEEARGPRQGARARRRGRRIHRELPPRRRRPYRRRLCGAFQAQSAADLRVGLRLRAERPDGEDRRNRSAPAAVHRLLLGQRRGGRQDAELALVRPFRLHHRDVHHRRRALGADRARDHRPRQARSRSP